MTKMTVEEFEIFVELPENVDTIYEYIGGQAVEVPSRPYASTIAAQAMMHIGNYVEEQELGHITGKGGGYQVSGERYAPDVAFISYERQPKLLITGYLPNAPDLAVEVLYPDSAIEQYQLRIKTSHYLVAGTMVWIINTGDKQVEIHEPNQPVVILTEEDTLTGKGQLAGFSMSVKNLFRKK